MMRLLSRFWRPKPLPLFLACSVYANGRVIGVLTVKLVGRAELVDFDVGSFEARLPIDDPQLIAACRSALDRSCAVPTEEIRAFPDYLETERRFKRWAEALRVFDGRKSIYTVWQKMELVYLHYDGADYVVRPMQKVRHYSYTVMKGPDGAEIAPRFDRLEDAVTELRRWMVRP
ncbi:hypothetical protein EGN72_05145 [Pseudorhodobacter sp. E13]|nr:hypothetical protein EGN72_05145 [Pseudorhodobacter sp. E13]